MSKGAIVLENVSFRYPSRPGALILNSINLQIEANTSVALVGHSGCGKSTIAALLLRFYDNQKGHITIDGIDIKDYNVADLRS